MVGHAASGNRRNGEGDDMRKARFLSPWKDSHEKPVIYHCISRVVERRFAFGAEEKERFRTLMRMMRISAAAGCFPTA